jgi:hypothetical protein
MNLETWQQQPALKANYVRLLSPEGEIEDIWRGYLEGALEASDEPLRMFYSQRQWKAFLAEQKELDNHWSSRHVFTAYDRVFLERGRVAWLDDMLWSIYFNYHNLELTLKDVEFLRRLKIAQPDPPADMTEAQERSNKRKTQEMWADRGWK